MASLADEFWQNVRSLIHEITEPYIPFLADVVAVTNGQVQIQPHDEEAPLGVASAREAGLALAVGDTVVAQRVAGGSVVVRARVQASAPGPQSVEGGLAAGNVSGTLATANIPNLDAGKITSGTLGTGRIPDLDAGKIASGVLAPARIPGLPYVGTGGGTVTGPFSVDVTNGEAFRARNGTGVKIVVVNTDARGLLLPNGTDLNLYSDNFATIKGSWNGSTGDMYVGRNLTMDGSFNHRGGTFGVYNADPKAKQAVSGSRGGNAALASLISVLAFYGLITDATGA